MSRIAEALVPSRLGRAFRRLVVASWTSNLGDGIALAAGPLLVSSQTHEPFLVALAGVVTMVPQLLFGLFAGALADRWNRQRIVIIGNLVRVAVLAVLISTIVSDRVSITVVLVTMFLLGTSETFVDTTTSTLMPMLVAKDDLGAANSRLMAGFSPPTNWPARPSALLVRRGDGVADRHSGRLRRAGRQHRGKIRFPTGGAAGGAQAHFQGHRRGSQLWLWRHRAIRTLALKVVSFNVTSGPRGRCSCSTRSSGCTWVRSGSACSRPHVRSAEW